jgi:2-polyprenyl-3-methyl-5-hydroxy-6-metoxy-1,4-benzoquinol methylase
MSNEASHWQKVYETKSTTQVSWYRPKLEQSLSLIQRALPSKESRIIDVGAGASTLVDDLLSDGYLNISILDISQSAL